MPASNEFHTIAIASITVGERTRKSFRNIDSLAQSISRIGLLHPIIITRDLKLIAGERRLRACKELKLLEIKVHYYDELNDAELKAIELEENIKRSDLTWKEEAEAMLSLHEHLSDNNKKWTPEKTAEEIGITRAMLIRYNLVATQLRLGNKNIASAENLGSAYNQCKREISRATDEVVANFISTEIIEEEEQNKTEDETTSAGIIIRKASLDLVKKDFLTWAPRYSGKKFNLIHCDFPYGINYQKSTQSGGVRRGIYADSPDIYWNLLACLCGNLDRILLPSAHIMFWFSMNYYSETLEFFQQHAPSLEIKKRPLIWHKSDNAGILPDPERGPRYTYETALLISRGDRRIVKSVAASYSAPTTRSKSQHLSQKPIPVLTHFFRMLVDDLSEVLDPTCGSATSLIAAEIAGAKRIYGMDINKSHIEHASTELDKVRRLKSASSIVNESEAG